MTDQFRIVPGLRVSSRRTSAAAAYRVLQQSFAQPCAAHPAFPRERHALSPAGPQRSNHGRRPTSPPSGVPRRALRGNENVGGDGHDGGMSELHITGPGTHLVWELWVSTEAPMVDVDSSAHLP
jgi:hypothetical protein